MKITIDESSANQRFDRFLRKFFKSYPQITLSDIFSAMRKGDILLNGKKKKGEVRVNL